MFIINDTRSHDLSRLNPEYESVSSTIKTLTRIDESMALACEVAGHRSLISVANVADVKQVPVENLESLQCVRYSAGQQYRYHM